MKTIHPETLEIHIDNKDRRVFFPIKGHEDAVLEFEMHTDQNPVSIEFIHTYVPSALRGTGIGSQLVERGLRLAKANGYEVIPTCSFVESYLEKHPEFQDLLATEAV